METSLVQLNPQLMALLAGAGGGHDLIPFNREVFVLNAFAAGTGYCTNIKEIQKDLAKDTQLTLRRHPDNEVDQFAIGLYYNQHRIGWVPMKDNLVIARLMDAGKTFTCKVVSVNRKDTDWPRINVSIYMVD